ncbi:hypothetical protein O2W15_14670 [Modestobacter sp. VKM Ac-2979]|uniref:hypothetical protein n=1 Tax=unclassified Modestobacter TaxID=2643866 RepID=UPI0022ABB01F|nr:MULTISPECIES: hypothetical protein [unclassified Modestobacter]MCZ2812679.1 hypothetical protein [Modestobacter sp. VKM Ac-2979]MCZ2841569.1 hypothetical protein [Modestobacter sp. VKM Ac-2980]
MSRVSPLRATVVTGLSLGTVGLGLALAPAALAATTELPALTGPASAVLGETIAISGADCDAAGATPAIVYVDVVAAADLEDPDATAALSLVGKPENGAWTAVLEFEAPTALGDYVVFAGCEPYGGTVDSEKFLLYPEFGFTLKAAPVTQTPVTSPPSNPTTPSTPATVVPTGELRGETANTVGVSSTKTAATTGASAVQGTKIVKVLTGFKPGEKVTVTLHSDPQTVGTFTADGNGTVTATFTLPAGTPAGEHDLVFEGDMGTYFQESLTVTAASSADSDDLAYTGASVALPLSLGGGLLVAGAGALYALRRRPAGAEQA